jgi:2-polyprenyl-3-methyl-5-hydroxy-6-metoxy-1,4-benzoquinol methylase
MSDLNRAWWDERVPLHVGSAFYDVKGFKAGGSTLRPCEVEEVGDVSGRSLVHIQCHFGLDTLSWARRGARVTGLDFSKPAIEAASALAAEVGLEAEFVTASVYDAAGALGAHRFDVVYTGLGALNWLPDLHRWANVIVDLLRPDGVLYLSEFHPITWVFGDDQPTLENDYFQREPLAIEEPGTYADLDAPTEHNDTEEWQHTLGDIVSAVLDAGLTLELLHEHDYTLFPRWPFLNQVGTTYRIPAGRPRLPLMFSLRARTG